MMSLHLKIIFLVVLFSSHWPLCLTEPSFRIIAPQTICKRDSNGSLTSNPQTIFVGFQPRDGLMLSYKVRIFFKSTTNRVRSQRNTLLVWKAIRSLENRLNVKERTQISKQNMFSFNKTEVEPGVIYMFHIVGVRDQGDVSKQKIFTITYDDDGVWKRNETNSGLNFLLIGAEDTYASIAYMLTARVSFCKPRYDYYIRWKMLGLDEEFQDILHTTGTVLKIPPKSLIAGKEYEIQASVMQSDNSLQLAQDFIKVEVKKRGFDPYIIPTSLKIGLNKPAIFEVSIKNFDNCEFLDITWECTAKDGGQCPSTQEANSTKVEFVFTVQGSYGISVTLKLCDVSKSIQAEVTVDPTVHLSYEFSHIPNLAPAAGEALQFTVLMVDLIPHCKAGWSTAQETDFEFIKPDKIGDGFGIVEVKDLEKQYLSEIADFGNSTTNKEIVLNIPVASGIWQGLEGEAKYKFRLDTVCPGPYDPNDAESVNKKVVSSFEFVINTNAPPIGGDLQVKPLNGSALRTVFEISSEIVKDILHDAPFSYEFLIQVEQYNISLGKFYEFKSIETQLPYSVSPVQIITSVCDIRGACNMNFGPKIKVDPVEYTSEEIQQLENRIKESFKRSDFSDGQNLIFMAAMTYKNSPNAQEVFVNFKTFAINLFQKQADKLNESPTEKYCIPSEKINSFVNQTHLNLEILNVNDPVLREKLLELAEFTAAEEKIDSTSANIEMFRRRKRDVVVDSDAVLLPIEGRSIIDAAYVRMNLNLIEKIIQSYKDDGSMQNEKAKIIQKIPTLAGKMCNSDLITKESIYSTVAAMDVEKMTGNHLVEKSFPIKNHFSKEAGQFQINMPALKSRVKYYCVAFIQFADNFLDGDKQAIYKLQIIDLGTSLPVKEVDKPSDNFVVGFIMPRSQGNHDICLMRNMEQWSPGFCSTKEVTETHIICKCRNFGFLKTGSYRNYMPEEVVTFASLSSSAVSSPYNNIVNKITTTEAMTTSRPNSLKSATTHATLQSTINTKDKDSEERTVTASALSYVIPLIGLLSILFIIGAVVFYKRRKQNTFGNGLQGFDIMETYPRERRPGLKYAKFYDEHLMTGNFGSNTSAA